MAPVGVASVTLVDNAERNTEISFYCSKANAEAFVAAADEAAADATVVGVAMLAAAALTTLTIVSKRVSFGYENPTPAIPANGLRGNKATLQLVASSGNKARLSIPGYNAADIIRIPNTVKVDVDDTSSTEWVAFKTALLAVATDKFGDAITAIPKGTFND